MIINKINLIYLIRQDTIFVSMFKLNKTHVLVFVTMMGMLIMILMMDGKDYDDNDDDDYDIDDGR